MIVFVIPILFYTFHINPMTVYTVYNMFIDKIQYIAID